MKSILDFILRRRRAPDNTVPPPREPSQLSSHKSERNRSNTRESTPSAAKEPSVKEPSYKEPMASNSISESVHSKTTVRNAFLRRYKRVSMSVKCTKYDLKRLVMKRIPIIVWLPKYKLQYLFSDLVAGVTVGLTLIPQAIAYASLAGLPPEYGLYTGFAGSLVYIFFGTVKEVSIGPAAVLALLTHHYTQSKNADFAVLLCFLSGLVEFLSGLLKLGFVVEFISVPVTAGFSSAAALLIASSQVKSLLGISMETEFFVDTWTCIFKNMSKANPWDLALSIGCCTFLLGMRKIKDWKIRLSGSPTISSALNQGIWLASISRNAIVVLACALLAFLLIENVGEAPFMLTGEIQAGFPRVGFPPFSTTVGNQTYNFTEMCGQLGLAIIIVPLISLLNNVAIAKAFATRSLFDGTQEMMALGLCNVFASFFSSMPVTGSFSRSAVNNSSGVQTLLGGLFTAVLVIVSLAYFTPFFYYIPKATLASVIICAVIFMFEYRLIVLMWRTSRKDLLPATITFICCLWIGIEYGVIVGLLCDVFFLLYLNTTPKCYRESVLREDFEEYVLFTPTAGITFPNVNHIRSNLMDAAESSDLPLIIDCSYVRLLDFSGLQGLKALVFDLKEKNRKVIFYKLREKLANKLSKMLGSDFIQVTVELEELSKDFLAGFRGSTVTQSQLDIAVHTMKKSSLKKAPEKPKNDR